MPIRDLVAVVRRLVGVSADGPVPRFRCTNCRCTFERNRRTCPECRRDTVRRYWKID
ncbi:hypothetical protein [Haladaptatus sp. DYSN1]|uniref:hypothetical protein n=1 Tax=unclassified Haladaptatus TaxID=2622732 RepID=UPI002406833B|nr:hypothetical protein [Haladaptatus sp. DYSN1]